MCFTARMSFPAERMKLFKRTPEFEKEFKRLAKKFRSLDEDIREFEEILEVYPTGSGTKFVIVHSDSKVKIVKARLACRALSSSSLRVIYAWHEDCVTFFYIELYHKSEKENEDRERISEYLKSL